MPLSGFLDSCQPVYYLTSGVFVLLFSPVSPPTATPVPTTRLTRGQSFLSEGFPPQLLLPVSMTVPSSSLCSSSPSAPSLSPLSPALTPAVLSDRDPSAMVGGSAFPTSGLSSLATWTQSVHPAPPPRPPLLWCDSSVLFLLAHPMVPWVLALAFDWNIHVRCCLWFKTPSSLLCSY